MMKNLIDLCIGAVIYFLLGFGLMYNGSAGGFIGGLDPFVRGDYSFHGVDTFVFFIFQSMFCATAATIVSGAMAGRCKFIVYVVYSAVVSAVIYPVSGHWIWNPDGWLARLGFIDFAGSTAVHMVGGVCALVGAALLGPRIGKYSAKGKARAIPGHSLTIATLGVFLLWFGWFGFNGASTLNVTGDGLGLVGRIFTTTNLSAACGAIMAMAITWIRYGKPDISVTINGALAGLVAITSGSASVTPAAALFIGSVAGFVVVFGIEWIDNKLKVDDPVGAISVHGVCGALGTLMTGLFAVEGGLFYTGSFRLLGVQALGVLTVGGWAAICAFLLFFILKRTIGLRVSPSAENAGLDYAEHGYAGNMGGGSYPLSLSSEPEREIDLSGDSPSGLRPQDYVSDGKMRKVVIIFNAGKFESLKNALEKIDITGITVSYVSGCGTQHGSTEYYRGSELELHLLPKIKVEIVISTVPLALLIDTAKAVLHTGNIGDGKIFVYDVSNVIKIRTGEEGLAALE
jgi:Amt family ammonium transporter